MPIRPLYPLPRHCSQPGPTRRPVVSTSSDKPTRRSCSGVGTIGTPQLGQTRRTNRCASTPMTELATRKGSTPKSSNRVIAVTASLVCNVEKTRCPVRGRLDRHARRFLVADFADHNHVRVLPKHGPQTGCEGYSFFVGDLCLADTVKAVLDRILQRQDVSLLRVQFLKSRVQRGCLSRYRSGRSQE